MKKIIIMYILIVTLLLQGCFYVPLKNKKICIDAGHGISFNHFN